MGISIEKSQAAIIADRAVLTARLMQFARSDCLLYWSPNEEVFKRQESLWLPVLHWAGELIQGELEITKGLDEPLENRKYAPFFESIIQNLNDAEFAAFYLVASIARSNLLALVFVKGMLLADEVFEAAFVEELWQAEVWGIDEEAEKRRQSIRSELQEIENFLHKNGEK